MDQIRTKDRELWRRTNRLNEEVIRLDQEKTAIAQERDEWKKATERLLAIFYEARGLTRGRTDAGSRARTIEEPSTSITPKRPTRGGLERKYRIVEKRKSPFGSDNEL